VTRDNYYVAVDDEWGKRAWLVDWGDGSRGLYDQDGDTCFDEYGQMQGTGFTLPKARKLLKEARDLARWDGRPGKARVFRLSGGRLVAVKARAAKPKKAAAVSLRRKEKSNA
jgi:hypothetical protein